MALLCLYNRSCDAECCCTGECHRGEWFSSVLVFVFIFFPGYAGCDVFVMDVQRAHQGDSATDIAANSMAFEELRDAVVGGKPQVIVEATCVPIEENELPSYKEACEDNAPPQYTV